MKSFLKKIIPLSLLLIVSLGPVLARETEVVYPEIPGITIKPVTTKALLPDYLRYIFGLFVIGIGLVSFGSFLVAGFKYLTSAGNPGQQKEAISHIFLSFIGTGIILGSYLISKTINPTLVNPSATVEITGGVKLGSGLCADNKPSGEIKSFNQSTPNIGFEAQSLKFISGPEELKVELWQEQNYKGNSNVFDSLYQECRDLAFPRNSFKLYWQLSGVYLCDNVLDASSLKCSGNEGYLPTKTALLSPEFNDKVKAIRLQAAKKSEFMANVEDALPGSDFYVFILNECEQGLNGTLNDVNGKWICTYETDQYGAVLHDQADWQGECEILAISDRDLNDSYIGQRTSSVTTFIQARAVVRPEDEGVWLCEEVNPQRPIYDRNAGTYHNPSQCYGRDPNNPTLPYQEERNDYIGDDKNDKISSIIIDGSYLAALFDNPNHTGQCQVFIKSDSNFLNDPIGRCNCLGNWGCDDCLSSFIILPTK